MRNMGGQLSTPFQGYCYDSFDYLLDSAIFNKEIREMKPVDEYSDYAIESSWP